MFNTILSKIRHFNYQRAKAKQAKILMANLAGLNELRKPTNPFYEEADKASLIWESQLKRLNESN